jgi:hypothetical protein
LKTASELDYSETLLDQNGVEKGESSNHTNSNEMAKLKLGQCVIFIRIFLLMRERNDLNDDKAYIFIKPIGQFELETNTIKV